MSRVVIIYNDQFQDCTGCGTGSKAGKDHRAGKIIAESRKMLVVNFCATWCKPCLEEIPYFIREVKSYNPDSFQLMLVSLDMKEQFPDGVRLFIKERSYEGVCYWLNETDADYFSPRIDQSWSGAIQATLFINN